MKYRIVRVGNLYKEQVNSYYINYGEFLQTMSYDEQYQHLMSYSCELFSFFSYNFKKLDVESTDIITNAFLLQLTWKKENNCNDNGKELVLAQIKKIKPNIVWIDDTAFLADSKWINALRNSVPSIKIVTGHICAPYNAELLKGFQTLDFIFTCTPCFKKELELQGIKTYLNYHSFEKKIIDRLAININSNKNKLVFTGSFITGGGFHKTRIEFIEEILKSGIDIEILGNIEKKSKIKQKQALYLFLNALKKMRLSKLIDNIPILSKYENYADTPVKQYSSKLRNSIKNAVFGIEMFNLLFNSQICLNLHGEVAKKCAGNIRLFEATGVGTCLVTDWKENLHELFEPEKEIVTYKTKEECIEKLKWLIQNPNESDKIAKAGQNRTLTDHSFEKRIEVINEIFLKNL